MGDGSSVRGIVVRILLDMVFGATCMMVLMVELKLRGGKIQRWEKKRAFFA